MHPNCPNCPVISFELYVSHLNPLNEFLFNAPREKSPLLRMFGTTTWRAYTWREKEEYIARSKTFQVLRKPFNQASAVTVLDKSGFEERHIMAARGHKKEPSIRSYSKTNICTKTKLSETLTTRFEVSVELSVMISHHSCPVLSISQEGVIKNSCRSEITKNVYFFNHNANLQNIFDVFKLFPLRAFQELFPYDIDFP